ncbi:MAG: transketolase [Candidatus Cloacimonadia bacterium]
MSDFNSHLLPLTRRVRRRIIETIYQAGSGHPGGSLSSVEIGTALFFSIMRHDPANPLSTDRDRFILSKGHAAPLLYVLLQEAGYIEEELLPTFRSFGSILQGHPSSLKCPGVEVSTGSLGQGLSVASGIALGNKYNESDSYTYVLLGDGELNEGQIWEAAMFASHYNLNNLIAFIDRNRLQIDGMTEEVMGLEPLADKWRAFNWNVQTIHGHSIPEIEEAVVQAKQSSRPSMIIANTVKGKGVSFMENKVGWHGKVPSEDEYRQALEELQ